MALMPTDEEWREMERERQFQEKARKVHQKFGQIMAGNFTIDVLRLLHDGERKYTPTDLAWLEQTLKYSS